MAEFNIDIDPDALDQEWLGQPRLALTVGEEEADARHAYNQAKAKLDLVWAELWMEARQTPSEFGLPEKNTLDDLKAAVTVHERHQKAVRLVNEAKHNLDLHSAAVNAVEHRKKALEEYTELHCRGYDTRENPPRPRNPEFRDGQEQRKLTAHHDRVTNKTRR